MRCSTDKSQMEYNAELLIRSDFAEAVAQRVVELLMPMLVAATQEGDGGDDKYLTISQLAAYSGISKSWLYANYKKAGIPHRYKNAPPLKREHPLFKRSEFDEWLRNRNEREAKTESSAQRRVKDVQPSCLEVPERQFRHQREKTASGSRLSAQCETLNTNEGKDDPTDAAR